MPTKRTKRGRESDTDSESNPDQTRRPAIRGKTAPAKKASKKAPAKASGKKAAPAPKKKSSAARKKKTKEESSSSESESDASDKVQKKAAPRSTKKKAPVPKRSQKKQKVESEDEGSSDEEGDATPKPAAKKATRKGALKLTGQTYAALAKLIQMKTPAVDWIGCYTIPHSNPSMLMGFLKKEAMALTKFLSFYQGSRDDGLDQEGDIQSQCPVALLSGTGGLARKLAIYYDQSGANYYATRIDLSKGWHMEKRSMNELAALGRADWFLGFLKDRMDHAAEFKVPVHLPTSADGSKVSLRDYGLLDSIGKPKSHSYSIDVQNFIQALTAQGLVDVIKILLKFFLVPENCLQGGIVSGIKIGSVTQCRLLLSSSSDDKITTSDSIAEFVQNTIKFCRNQSFADLITFFIDEHGADLTQSVSGMTATQYAARETNFVAMKWFIAKGIDLVTPDCLEPLLLSCAIDQQLEKLKYWMSQGTELQKTHHRSQAVLRKVFRDALTRNGPQAGLAETNATLAIMEYCLNEGMEVSEAAFEEDKPLQQPSHYSSERHDPLRCITNSSQYLQRAVGEWLMSHGYPMKNLDLVIPWIDEAFERNDIETATRFLRSIPSGIVRKTDPGNPFLFNRNEAINSVHQTGLTHLLCRAMSLRDRMQIRPLVDILLAIGADGTPIEKNSSRYASSHQGYGAKGYHYNPTSRSQSALLRAMQLRDCDLVKYFLDAGGETIRSSCVVPIERTTPAAVQQVVSHSYFHCAIRTKNEEILKIFLDAKYNTGGAPAWKGEFEPAEYTYESRPDYQTRSWYSKYTGYNEHRKYVGTKQVRVEKPRERWPDVAPFTLPEALEDLDRQGLPIFEESERLDLKSWLIEVGLVQKSNLPPAQVQQQRAVGNYLCPACGPLEDVLLERSGQCNQCGMPVMSMSPPRAPKEAATPKNQNEQTENGGS